jgi:hypothetical protein
MSTEGLPRLSDLGIRDNKVGCRPLLPAVQPGRGSIPQGQSPSGLILACLVLVLGHLILAITGATFEGQDTLDPG